MKTVLIVSYSRDKTAGLLIQRLREVNQPVQLIDLGMFPDKTTASIEFSTEVSVKFCQCGVNFTGTDIKSIWWRRPRGKTRSDANNLVYEYVALESEVFINSLFCLLGPAVKWVSSPENTRLANRKPVQLKVAQCVGFQIPKTLITNDPDKVTRFFKANPYMPLIMKPVGSSFVRLADPLASSQDSNLAIYTKLIDRSLILKNIQKVKNCPVIFQEAVMKEFDVRITVVGDKVFAVKITHSKDCGLVDGNLDWRHHKLDRRYEPHQLPYDLQIKCVELVNQLGLSFGAIDMCFSKEKGYMFLEINPQGQWVPSEVMAGHPISHALAELLTT